MKQIQPFQKHWPQITSIVVCRLKLWSSPWPVPNIDCFTVSPLVQLLPVTHSHIVEWGLYWSSLPCSYHWTFMKLAPHIHLMKCLLLILLVKLAAELPRPPGLLLYMYFTLCRLNVNIVFNFMHIFDCMLYFYTCLHTHILLQKFWWFGWMNFDLFLTWLLAQQLHNCLDGLSGLVTYCRVQIF